MTCVSVANERVSDSFGERLKPIRRATRARSLSGFRIGHSASGLPLVFVQLNDCFNFDGDVAGQ